MRVVEAVEGGPSRREVAELYGISPNVVVIWMQRWAETGSIEAKQSGGSVSPLDEHAEFLLGLIVERPDMTLDEIVVAMSRAGIEGSRTAVWRFYERHEISFKKNFVRSRAKARRRSPRTPTLDARNLSEAQGLGHVPVANWTAWHPSLLKRAPAKVLQGSHRTSWAFPGFCPPTSHDSNAQAGQAVRVATPERRRIGF